MRIVFPGKPISCLYPGVLNFLWGASGHPRPSFRFLGCSLKALRVVEEREMPLYGLYGHATIDGLLGLKDGFFLRSLDSADWWMCMPMIQPPRLGCNHSTHGTTLNGYAVSSNTSRIRQPIRIASWECSLWPRAKFDHCRPSSHTFERVAHPVGDSISSLLCAQFIVCMLFERTCESP